jgi:membrane-associated phospholipid phosphatase
VAIACIVPLWLMLPPRRRLWIATPATLLALCVAASRLVLNAHHLSDVLTSTWLGIVIAAFICDRFQPGSVATGGWSVRGEGPIPGNPRLPKS